MEAKLKEYAEIAARMKIDEARQKLLKAEIEAELGDNGKADTEFGSYVMVPRASWEYSVALKEAAEDLKIQQQDEQEQGIANKSVSYNLRFNPNKTKSS